MNKNCPVGRFAPTPSGPLHFGSLVTAVASYCSAKSQQGKWLLRIEDIDTSRNVVGAVDSILSTLDAFGFEWDDTVEYQSHQPGRYAQVLQFLLDQQYCYACACSRRILRAQSVKSSPLGLVYPGNCRNRKLKLEKYAIRLNTTSSGKIHYHDAIFGQISIDVEKQLGDFVLRRMDGIYAYHLAVVVDDQYQGVDQVVRGADLLEATCLHLLLQRLLGYRQPKYWHIPLVRNQQGVKLSKQTGAVPVSIKNKVSLLIQALQILGQVIDPEMQQATVSDILRFAVEHWQYKKIPLIK